MNEIKNCPFCSSNKLKVEKKKRSSRYHINGNLDNYTASVRCNVCHARGPAISGWVRNRRFVNENEWLPDEMYVEELEHLAIEAWNTRKPIDDMSEPKITTNADRIRSMTDEELAEFIFSQVQAKCSNHDCVGADYCYYHADWDGECGYGCEQAIEAWLKEKCEA